MSQRDVESTLGRLLTDAAFRVRFLTRPDATAQREGLNLKPDESRALERLPVGVLLELASYLDDRVRRYEPPDMPASGG